MADENSSDYRASCAEDNDEIEGLNEKLIQQLLLSTPKFFSSESNSSLCDIRLENNSGSNIDSKAFSSLSFSHCRHDCSLLCYDSPAKMSSTSNHLPPIGVFWDIENCQVELDIISSFEKEMIVFFLSKLLSQFILTFSFHIREKENK